jgi:hypothetical protein
MPSVPCWLARGGKVSKVIIVSDEVYQFLQDWAKSMGYSFVSPDNILRAILELKQSGNKQIKTNG